MAFGSIGVADKDMKMLMKEAIEYAILLEQNYPAEGKYKFPDPSHVAWAQACR
jgi:hypothetical protein